MSTPTTRINLRIDVELLRAIDAAAAHARTSREAFVRSALCKRVGVRTHIFGRPKSLQRIAPPNR